MFHIEPLPEACVRFRLDDGKVNAMSHAWLARFPDAWRQTEGSRAVVMVGNAKTFCAGLDLKALPALCGDELVRYAADLMTCFRIVHDDPRPIVATIEGPALAGGAILALCADLRVVGPGARMGVTEVPVGVPFPPPLFALLRSQLPTEELAPATYQGAVRAGASLVEHGWAHRFAAYPAHEAQRLAAELAGHSPVAYAAAKVGLRADASRALASFDAKAWASEMRLPETQAALARTIEKLTTR